MKNIDNAIARGDISRCNVVLSVSSNNPILDSNRYEYDKKRNALNINADINPMANDIRKAAP